MTGRPAHRARSIPFIDFANRCVLTGASYDPRLLQGLTQAQIAEQLHLPRNPIAQGADGTANLMTAAIFLADHGGNGVGRATHEDPFAPNEGRPDRGYRLRPGLVLALEPMLIADGSDVYVTGLDGWALRMASDARTAHSEHTIAVIEDGLVVLTALPGA